MAAWEPWLAWTVAVLVLLSIIVELSTGRSRLRGLGSYRRVEQPVHYWLAIALKAAIAGLIALMALKPFH